MFFAARAEEEMASNVHPKMTNQLFVASQNNNHDPMDSLNAATFVAVVSSYFI